MSQDDDDFIKGLLGRLPRDTVKYPPTLKTATRAEYKTMIKKMDKKKGCPLAVLILILKFSAIIGTISFLG